MITITNEGKVVVYKSDLLTKLMIGLYLIGAAYAKIAELRPDDEIIEQLKMKDRLSSQNSRNCVMTV